MPDCHVFGRSTWSSVSDRKRRDLESTLNQVAMQLSGLAQLPRPSLPTDRSTCKRHFRATAAALANHGDAFPAQRLAARDGSAIGYHARSAIIAGASSVADPPSQDAQAHGNEREIKEGVFEGSSPPPFCHWDGVCPRRTNAYTIVSISKLLTGAT